MRFRNAFALGLAAAAALPAAAQAAPPCKAPLMERYSATGTLAGYDAMSDTVTVYVWSGDELMLVSFDGGVRTSFTDVWDMDGDVDVDWADVPWASSVSVSGMMRGVRPGCTGESVLRVQRADVVANNGGGIDT